MENMLWHVWTEHLCLCHLAEDENTRTSSRRELGAAAPAALLRDESRVRADRDARGPGAPVRGAPGGGGDRGLQLRDQADAVHPCARTQDALLRDAVWDCDRRGWMLPVQGLTRCVFVCVCVCAYLQQACLLQVAMGQDGKRGLSWTQSSWTSNIMQLTGQPISLLMYVYKKGFIKLHMLILTDVRTVSTIQDYLKPISLEKSTN